MPEEEERGRKDGSRMHTLPKASLKVSTRTSSEAPEAEPSESLAITFLPPHVSQPQGGLGQVLAGKTTRKFITCQTLVSPDRDEKQRHHTDAHG